MMKKFRVIPVIDILNSEVVHAVRGERENYKPLKSKLFESVDPVKIVEKFIKVYKLHEIYIADLDAIMKKIPNLQLLKKILNIPEMKIIIDPGIESMADIKLYSNFKIHKLILGLETITDPKIFTDCLRIFGNNRTIVSIDMFNEVVQTKIERYKDLSLINIIKDIETFGIKEIILLDLHKVGQKFGGIPLIYKKIRSNFKGKIIVGGGIKDFNNVLDYYNNDFSGVLIGTALHDGTIPIDKISEFK